MCNAIIWQRAFELTLLFEALINAAAQSCVG